MEFHVWQIRGIRRMSESWNLLLLYASSPNSDALKSESDIGIAVGDWRSVNYVKLAQGIQPVWPCDDFDRIICDKTILISVTFGQTPEINWRSK